MYSDKNIFLLRLFFITESRDFFNFSEIEILPNTNMLEKGNKGLARSVTRETGSIYKSPRHVKPGIIRFEIVRTATCPNGRGFALIITDASLIRSLN